MVSVFEFQIAQRWKGVDCFRAAAADRSVVTGVVSDIK